MNTKKMRAGGLAFVIAATGAFGLTACSSDSDAGASTDTEVSEETTVDVAADLETAKAAVDEALAEDPSWTQVMLASDVESPTQKYGLLVMPYVPTDAVEHVTGTVNIDGGNYVIEAESAATGETWQIDQDGTISEVTE
ncbi:hypothetical protein [Demequina sp. NBRC 110057]|uniref:hypothetical protein n=1 Tax=Demequina sp. NBRC 110057 TaxID=1570346 RepID=UPI000A075EF8|nr:hypothetical protein [Demequina sp. NBRC 110057]